VMDFLQRLENVSWIATINSTSWMISLVWLAHYLGVFLMIGSVVFVDLRILGFAGRKYRIAQLAGLLFPLSWTGFCFVLTSGFIMFAGQARTFYIAPFFALKMAELAVALVVGVVVQRKVPQWDRLTAIPAGAKWVAFVSLVLWIGAILAALEVPAFTAGI
jgi:hypothetical protein